MTIDLSNPNKIMFSKMPKEVQWAIRGALNDGANVEYFAQGKWREMDYSALPLSGSICRVRPEPVREAEVLDVIMMRHGASRFTITPYLALDAQYGTKGTVTVTKEDGKAIELTWKAD